MEDIVIFSNTRGFQKNKGEIDKFIEMHKPTVFLVAEHFQSNNLHLKLDGYVLAASYCRFIRERGGVAIFVRTGIEYTSRKDLDTFNLKKQFEIRSIEIPSRSIVIAVVYRPPSGKLTIFKENLDKVLKLCNTDPSRRHLIAGDFNVKVCDRKSTEKVLEKYSFHFIFSSKTHEAGACLDNFIVDFIPSSKKIMDEKLSDHNSILLILPPTLKSPFKQAARNPEAYLEYGRAYNRKNLVDLATRTTESNNLDHLLKFDSSLKSKIKNNYPMVREKNKFTHPELYCPSKKLDGRRILQTLHEE